MASSGEGDDCPMVRGADKLSNPPGKIASKSSMNERTLSPGRASAVVFGLVAGLLEVVGLGEGRRDLRKEVELFRGKQFRRHDEIELLKPKMVRDSTIVTMAWASLNIIVR